MNKTHFLILFLAIISIQGGLYAQQFINPEKISANNPALDFSLADLDGKQHHIEEWQDKIRIINFWATWCPPCLKEMPEFIKLQKAWTNKDIQFIGIAIDEPQNVANYLKTHPVNYPILLANNQGVAISQRLGNTFKAVPFTVIINRSGQIIHRQPGEISTETLLEISATLLKNNQ